MAACKPKATCETPRHLAPMEYVWDLYKQHPPELAFGATTESAAKAWRRKLKARFLDLMGDMDAPRCDLAAEITETRQCDGYKLEHLLFQSRPNLTVAAWVLTPDDVCGKLPAMVCLQGHGAGKDAICGVCDEPYQANFAIQAVRRGFVVIAPDQYSFGERRDAEDIAQGGGNSSCRKPSVNLMLMGKSIAGVRVYDVMRCIDYLETRPEVDAKRVGCMGISGGGTITTFAAAVDERIKASLISGYLSYWRDSIMPIFHCDDNYIAGLLKYAEMPDIACLIAPRPVFFENGDLDGIFPLKSARAGFRAIKQAYEVYGCADRCKMQVFKGEHSFCGEKGFPFLEKWLKG